jgi:hypothetical protein
MQFLLGTGADLYVIKRSSLQPGIKCPLEGGIDIKGISNTIMETEGTIMLKLFTHIKSHKLFTLLETNLVSNTMVF